MRKTPLIFRRGKKWVARTHEFRLELYEKARKIADARDIHMKQIINTALEAYVELYEKDN